jgi:hypothetical protein
LGRTLGVDVLDFGGSQHVDLRLDLGVANELLEAGLTFASNDNVTLDADTAGSFLNTRMGPGGLGLGILGTNIQGQGLGLDVLSIGQNGKHIADISLNTSGDLFLNSSDASQLIDAGLSFAGVDNVTLNLDENVQGTYLGGNSLSQLGHNGLGVDVLDFGGAQHHANVHLNGEVALQLLDNGLHIANNDLVTVDADIAGTFLSNRMGHGGLGLGMLGTNIQGQGLGLDVLSISQNNEHLADITLNASGDLFLNAADASNLIDAGLNFAASDNATLNLADNAEGTFLGVSGLSLGGHNLQDLGNQGLGVDAIDFGGQSNHVSLALHGNDVQSLIDNGISIAANDFVTLESDVNGTFLSTRLGASDHSHVGATGLGLDALGMQSNHGGIGLDQLLIKDGNHLVASIEFGTNGSVLIDQSDLSGLINEGLNFASSDNVSLDLTSALDGQALGSFMSTGLASADHLHSLGVDSVQVLQEALIDLVTTEPDSLFAWDNFTGITNAPSINVVLDQGVGNSNEQPLQIANDVADVVNSLISAGVQFADDASMGELLSALSDSGINGLPAVDSVQPSMHLDVGFEVKAQANVAMSDELARALYDAGMMDAVPQAKVQIDAGMTEILRTPFKLLAEYGVDKVTTGQDKVYMELGDISDLVALSQAVESLMDGKPVDEENLFLDETQGQSHSVHAGLILDANENSELIHQLLNSDAVSIVADLVKLGVTELDIKGYAPTAQDPVQGTPVEVLGSDYTAINLTDLLNKQGHH